VGCERALLGMGSHGIELFFLFLFYFLTQTPPTDILVYLAGEASTCN